MTAANTALLRYLPRPLLPDPGERARRALLSACWAGGEPAEVLDTTDREDLVHELWRLNWTDVAIAQHTRMTTYTTARIRERLGLGAN